MSERHDAVVIGAGLNGLSAAALLAGEGFSVVVLERRDTVGGIAVTETVEGDIRFDTAAHRIGWLHPSVASLLKRAPDGGPRLLEPEATLFAPLADGGSLTLWRDPARTLEEIRRFSTRDAERWPRFVRLVADAVDLLKLLYRAPPPEPLATSPTDLLSFLRPLVRLRRLGRRRMTEVLRLFPMSLEEWLDEWFESDALKGALAGLGVINLFRGPLGPGTTFNFLHQQVGMRDAALPHLRLVSGGIGRLTQAMEAVARHRGVRVRTSLEVKRILSDGDSTLGVGLANGEEIRARRVISSLDPRSTFLDLLGPGTLEPTFLRAIRNIRFRGCCAKVNLALERPPAFSAASTDGAQLSGLIRIGPNLMGLERAYDDAKYGEPSREPQLEVVLSATGAEQGVALSALVQYAPYALADGAWDAQRREELGDRVVAVLERHAPGIESTILHRRILTPADLEVTFGLTEGQIHHGEMGLDQTLFMRPVPGWARYRTPVKNLFLSGAGTHPGGGVTGAPGANAAAVVARTLRKH